MASRLGSAGYLPASLGSDDPRDACPAAELLKPAALHAKAPATYGVAFTTTKGTFVVTVHRSWAPLGADRFYNLVKAGFYNGDEFFRVLKGFVVQFGISGYPQVSSAWQNANLKDDPVKTSNTVGTITYAAARRRTRARRRYSSTSPTTPRTSTGWASRRSGR